MATHYVLDETGQPVLNNKGLIDEFAHLRPRPWREWAWTLLAILLAMQLAKRW